MENFLISYDQPLILLGGLGLVAMVCLAFQVFDQRDRYDAENIFYQMAVKRTKWIIAGFALFGAMFATGWAIPNPAPTFASAYGNCMFNLEETTDNHRKCLGLAKTLMEHIEKKPS